MSYADNEKNYWILLSKNNAHIMQITQYFKCHRGYQKEDMRRNKNKLLYTGNVLFHIQNS